MTLQRLPQHLFFDLDGTLLDSLPGITYSFDQALAAEGLAPRTQDLRAFIGPPIRGIFARALNTTDSALLDRLEAAFRRSYDTEGWQKTPCFPHAASTLRSMAAAGHTLYVVSNKPHHIALRILEAEDVLGLFKRIVTRDSRSPAFPHKSAMIADLLQEEQLQSSSCLMVGDTMEDAGAAADNLLPFAFLEHGYGEITPGHPVHFRLQGFANFAPYLTSGDCT